MKVCPPCWNNAMSQKKRTLAHIDLWSCLEGRMLVGLEIAQRVVGCSLTGCDSIM